MAGTSPFWREQNRIIVSWHNNSLKPTACSSGLVPPLCTGTKSKKKQINMNKSTDVVEKKMPPLDIEIAEYTQISEMAKQHASYRFTMFGFFVTLSTAIIGASGWLLISQKNILACCVVAFFGLCTSVAAIMIDRRTMQLYNQCEQHARSVEETWRNRWSFPQTTGIYTALATGERSRVVNHGIPIRFLYLMSGILCILLVVYALFA